MNIRKKRALLLTLANTLTVIIITIILIKSRHTQQTRNQVTQPTEYLRGVEKVTSSLFKISKTTRSKIWSSNTKRFTSQMVEISSTLEHQSNPNMTQLCEAIATKYRLNQDTTVPADRSPVLDNSTHIVTTPQTVATLTHRDKGDDKTNSFNVDTTLDIIHNTLGAIGISCVFLF